MKSLLKVAAEAVAYLFALPPFCVYSAQRLCFGSRRTLPGWSQAISLVPGLAGVYLRRAFYRLTFPLVGRDSWIGFGSIFSHGENRIGDRTYIGNFCCLGEVTLGDDVLIGSHVSITNGSNQHGIARIDIPIREQPGVWPRTIIGNDSWIGDRAVILADVGAHCVVGAGAVVTRPVPDYAIVAGIPAKVIRFRNAS